jgi:uncharacterized protein DUF551
MDWIDMDEEYPPVGQIVLCCDAISECVSLGRLTENETFDFLSVEPLEADVEATHWMELPKIPDMTYEEN